MHGFVKMPACRHQEVGKVADAASGLTSGKLKLKISRSSKRHSSSSQDGCVPPYRVSSNPDGSMLFVTAFSDGTGASAPSSGRSFPRNTSISRPARRGSISMIVFFTSSSVIFMDRSISSSTTCLAACVRPRRKYACMSSRVGSASSVQSLSITRQ